MKRYKVFAAILILAMALAASSVPLTLAQTATPSPTAVSPQETETATPEQEMTPTPEATAAPTDAEPSEFGEAILSGVLVNIYDTVNPSVVNISVTQGVGPMPDAPGTPFQGPPQQVGGSGFVWDDQGHIVTNYHVVENAQNIFVTFSDGMSASGTIIGTDPDSDLAVIQVDVPADELRPIEVADSEQVRVGQLAVAIGNPYGLAGTMTAGIVSAVGRLLPVQTTAATGPSYVIPDVIQTDAAVNPGNSGGVLLNEDGELIGVPSAIISSTGASAGIGFAIPSAIVQKVVPALIEDGTYQHPYIGISGTSLTSAIAEAMGLPATQRGALVVQVTPGGPADEAGLQGSSQRTTINGIPMLIGGDVIVSIDDQSVETFDDIITWLAHQGQVGETVTLTVIRDGQEEAVDLTLEARPGGQVTPTPTPQQPAEGQAWLGIVGVDVIPVIAEAMDLPADQTGVLIVEVVQGSPADQAGLRGGFRPQAVDGNIVLLGGDVITSANDQEIAEMQDLLEVIQEMAPGDEMTLTILRDGEEQEVTATLAERPQSLP